MATDVFVVSAIHAKVWACEDPEVNLGSPGAGINPEFVKVHPSLGSSVHAVLKPIKPVPRVPERLCVNFVNGSTGQKVQVAAKSSDTVEKLLKIVGKNKAKFKSCVNLSVNGKPVKMQQTMAELQLQSGATFISFQKCHGG